MVHAAGRPAAISDRPAQARSEPASGASRDGGARGTARHGLPQGRQESNGRGDARHASAARRNRDGGVAHRHSDGRGVAGAVDRLRQRRESAAGGGGGAAAGGCHQIGAGRAARPPDPRIPARERGPVRGQRRAGICHRRRRGRPIHKLHRCSPPSRRVFVRDRAQARRHRGGVYDRPDADCDPRHRAGAGSVCIVAGCCAGVERRNRGGRNTQAGPQEHIGDRASGGVHSGAGGHGTVPAQPVQRCVTSMSGSRREI